MLDIVLYQPEIPPNTGNSIRLAANTGAHLHLVRPLGFDLSDRQLARAGLDYHDLARVSVHDDFDACCRVLAGRRMFALSTKGEQRYDKVEYREGDVLLFGRETSGLPADVLSKLPQGSMLRIPMCPSNRSVNLSNAVAVVVFEAWRQLGFAGAAR
ncbi:MAG: tRNA (cytidine/uridine-2'-O-)-methyltransferase [Azoarcus sp.]|uniref:tRNA (cytidine(34)-2'-O)-methyltransferase n=1 Tax=Aromatoleum tolulyticum TaxID=34027 RepID=A0A1N6SFF6_9RHOO|nr:tRNA (cytidine(34)-2'-O)-methyltransferase [Aromatoleum tolulyticum]MCK9986840.1 tRNA (cytidine/uridine-2'-O-)-methyltransferase [Azoarcus sp.]SIQ39759.1 tRNA (cytidine/uridine-2'-O-)-methyltransferase [Aromatoleum tolulyticum]